MVWRKIRAEHQLPALGWFGGRFLTAATVGAGLGEETCSGHGACGGLDHAGAVARPADVAVEQVVVILRRHSLRHQGR